MPKNRLHVKPDGDLWVVQKEGSRRASFIANTKRDALERAADIARNQNLSVVVHGADGRIQRTYRPGDQPSGGDCFITTACVEHYGLSDTCYELSTLRHFRDEYMLSTGERAELVKEYYQRAPAMVAKLNRCVNRDEVYAEILHRIRLACAAIELGQFDRAEFIYAKALRWLERLPD